MFNLQRRFWIYKSTHAISRMGDLITLIAFPWWVLQQTHSATTLSQFVFFQMGIQLIVNPILGTFIDLIQRGFLYIGGNLLCVLGLIGFALVAFYTSKFTVQLYFIYGVYGIGRAIVDTIEPTILPDLVLPEQIDEAYQFAESFDSLAYTFGALFASLLVLWIGPAKTFLVDAMTFIIAILGISLTPLPVTAYKNNIKKISLNFWWKQFQSGMTVLRKKIILIYLLLLPILIYSFHASFAKIAIPQWVQSRGLPVTYYGIFEALIYIGTIFATSFFMRFISLGSNAKIFVGLAMMSISAGIFLFSKFYWLTAILAFLYGIGIGFSFTTLKAQWVKETPLEQRGQLLSLKYLFVDLGGLIGAKVIFDAMARSHIVIILTIFVTLIFLPLCFWSIFGRTTRSTK